MYTKLLEVVVGSTVHGTSVDDGLEDLDLMAVVLEEPDLTLGFGEKTTFVASNATEVDIFRPKDTWVERTKPEGVRSEAGDVDYVAYGLRKYLKLALSGNPSVLLALFVQGKHVRISTKAGEELRALAPSIVSRKVYATFKGYMHQQRQRMLGLAGQKNCTRPELVEKYGYDTKYAGHVIRLGLQGVEILRTGRLELPMREMDRALVVNVRTGKYELDWVNQTALLLEKELDVALSTSKLPDEPDYEKLQEWCVKTYLEEYVGPAPL